MKNITIFIDGGSRGNPGPSAFGVAFLNESNEILKKYSQYIGEKTNNEAEYQALIFALKKAKALFGRDLIITIKSDSELLVKQMNGKYKVKNPNIQKLFLEAWNLRIDFKNLNIILIPREQNKIADSLVNEALDNEKKINKLF